MTNSDFVPTDDLSTIREMDEHVVHPWESFDRPNTSRTIIDSGAGVYVYDDQGNRLLDGPGGMWCVNVGCILYRADAADDVLVVDRCGRVYTNKKKHTQTQAVT